MRGACLDDRYLLGESLGAGGHGQVFLARDTKLGRDVAIKMLKEEPHPASLARLRREAAVLADIQHPNVVFILDVGADYVVMQRLSGPSLAQLAYDRRPFPFDEAARHGVAIAGALTVLHTRPDPIVHRDIKPGNLVLDGDVIKLCDFGLARKPLGGLTPVTQTGHVLGTPGYMSPEQLDDLDPAPPADVYALGATLYAVLCGKPPFGLEDGLNAYLQRVTAEEPPSLLDRRPDVPRDLANLIHRMLAIDPADRPDAAQVRDALADLGGAGAAAEAVTARFTEQFAQVQALFAEGKEARAAFALVRLLGRAQAALGSEHQLVRRMNAYADLRRTL